MLFRSKKLIEKLRKGLPKLLTEKVEELEKKYKLPKGIGKYLIDTEFENLVKKFEKLEPLIIARTLINTPNEIKRDLKMGDFEEVLSFYRDGKIAKEAITDLLFKKWKGEKIDVDKFYVVSEHDIEKEVRKIIEEKPGLNEGAYMGLVMAKFRGKIDGKKAMEIVKKFLE